MRAFWFFLKFVMLTVPLTWLWIEWGRGAYGQLFNAATDSLYGVLDLGLSAGGARERYINYIPFLALMLITPRVSISRRVFGIAAGFLAIFTFQVIFSLWVQIAYPPGPRTTTGFAIFLPALLLSDSLPLILWAILCHDFVSKAASETVGKLGLSAKQSETAAPPAVDSSDDRPQTS